jgi:ATP/maltotriose-dependent transcriptional regulator MalT
VGEERGRSAPASETVVGREAERAAIEDFLPRDRAPARALLIEGQAGIGKTTLCEAAADIARDRGYEILCCGPSGAEATLSYAALADLLRPVYDRVRDALPEPQQAALAVALLLSSPGASAVDQRAVATGLLTSLRRLEQERPLLVAIDDAQWLDAPSAAVLEFALRRLDSEQIAILIARRSDGAERVPLSLERAFVGDRFARLRIDALSVGALHRLVRLRTGVALPRPTLLRVHAASEGNPFYALEIVRTMLRRGESLAAARPLPTPETIANLVRERVGQLPVGAQRVLQAATVPSKPTTTLVAALVNGRAAAHEGLDQAVEAGLVELEDERIRFAHPLLASAVYSDIEPDARRTLHRRLSELVADQEERARHRALGAEAADAAIAATLDAAARHAASRGAPGAGAELLELAVRLTPSGDVAETWRRRTEQAAYLRVAADFDAARALLRRLLEEMPAGADRARAAFLLAQTSSDDFDTADRLCRQALSEAQGDDRLVADIHHFWGGLAVVRGDLRLGLARTRTALPVAERAGDLGLLVSCLASLALYETFVGVPTSGRLERAEHLREALHGEPMVNPQAVRARRHLYIGRLDAAREGFAALYREAAARGDEYNRGRLLYGLALVEIRAGRYLPAAQLAREGFEIMEHGGGQDRSALLYPTSLADAFLGRIEEARAGAQEGIAQSRAARDEIYWLANRSVLGFLDLSLGDLPAAAGHLNGLPGRLAAMGYGEPNIYPLLPDAVEALIGVDDLVTASGFVEELEQSARRVRTPWTLACSLRCRGLLVAAEGDPVSALTVLERALPVHDGMQQPFERARTLLALGTLQRRVRRRRAARESLDAAARIFGELGTPLWLEKATSELQRIGGRAPSSGGLTPSEQRVAALVSEGKTNREVAAALFVSERTVEGHLTRIYPKLGVRSRAELAGRLGSAEGRGPSEAFDVSSR